MAIRIRDDMKRDLVFLRPPRRIVSLVPSDTETVFALGAGDRVVCRTRYCVEPAGAVEAIPTCGGTKDIDVDAVAALEPDLVLCNQEENSRPALEALAQSGHQVFVSFPHRVADGIAHMARLARVLGITADSDVRELIRRGHRLQSPTEPDRTEEPARSRRAAPAVFVPIWLDPLMTLSGDTFGSDMLALCGARNVFADRERRYPLAADLGQRPARPPEQVGDRDTRYPRITWDEVVQRAPDAVLLPDEPYPFAAEHVDRVAASLAGHACPVHLISGQDLFWYGARSVDAVPRLRAVIDQVGRPG